MVSRKNVFQYSATDRVDMRDGVILGLSGMNRIIDLLPTFKLHAWSYFLKPNKVNWLSILDDG